MVLSSLCRTTVVTRVKQSSTRASTEGTERGWMDGCRDNTASHGGVSSTTDGMGTAGCSSGVDAVTPLRPCTTVPADVTASHQRTETRATISDEHNTRTNSDGVGTSDGQNNGTQRETVASFLRRAKRGDHVQQHNNHATTTTAREARKRDSTAINSKCSGVASTRMSGE